MVHFHESLTEQTEHKQCMLLFECAAAGHAEQKAISIALTQKTHCFECGRATAEHAGSPCPIPGGTGFLQMHHVPPGLITLLSASANSFIHSTAQTRSRRSLLSRCMLCVLAKELSVHIAWDSMEKHGVLFRREQAWDIVQHMELPYCTITRMRRAPL
eukprot:1134335-Pelagomonas_calceolata.AAC.3